MWGGVGVEMWAAGEGPRGQRGACQVWEFGMCGALMCRSVRPWDVFQRSPINRKRLASLLLLLFPPHTHTSSWRASLAAVAAPRR